MARETAELASPLMQDGSRSVLQWRAGRRWSVLAVGFVFVTGVIALIFRSSTIGMARIFPKMLSREYQVKDVSCTNFGDEDNQFCMPVNSTSAQSPPFTDYEMNLIYLYFLSNMNVQGIGGVLASPDKETPGGSYYYHWERDAALVMRTMIAVRKSYPDYHDLMMTNLLAYVEWNDQVQKAKTPNGIDIRVEPKFELPHGNVFNGSWCRPQNDGPGLKAIALIELVQMMWADGDNETIQLCNELIKSHLWTNDTSDAKFGGSIRHNLEYVVNHWASYTCDLWEEVASNDFFWNRVTMKKALVLGARFARSVGSIAKAEEYDLASKNLDRKGFLNHWNESWRGSSLYVKEDPHHAKRDCDGAVILGFNHGWDEVTKDWPPQNYMVAKTVLEYNRLFTREYATNSMDTERHVPGILYGRYPNDNYAAGNAWIMTTAALAQLLYRAGSAIKKYGLPDDRTMQVWRQALHFDLSDDQDEMALTFATAGDAVMLRIREHIKGDNFHMFEQIDRESGKQVGARDLTWSYAEVLWAMAARKDFFHLASINASRN